MKPKLKNGIALSLIPQIILVKWLGSYPELIERYYSEGIYPVISKFLRLLTGWIPFSVGDILYTVLVLLAFRYLYRNWKKIKSQPLFFLRDIGVVLSLAYFIFHLYWGLNYYRVPLTEKLDFQADYTQEELLEFTMKMVHTTNVLQLQLTKDVEKPVVIPYTTEEVYEMTLNSYKRASRVFPIFTYKQPSLKSSLFSLPLTYMGYGGYINPFTNEAQVNYKVPILRLPSISGHEVGHQIGYSSESDTNFIGLIVTSANKDVYFQYAAQSHGLAYCLSDLRRKDEKAYKTVLEKLNPGVLANFRELSEFWNRYENPTEPIFKAVFNAFLKANNQKDGIQSYNAVVGLMIGYDRAYGF
ncbi:DUF3810 domain-containing protein [Croceivirga thetidis]|uniref:DUF3810 domain-containing protein n=1 Tax=Croceivirga thetidis TaxID=2721623 RepID=A0ABX1GV92_9FLAO|nr:DUF3810 domain-containing protein [Croceivirga thetidis]NKI32835.1 DUF3810 domain-containing protein [Croceivirga thetidis]